MKQLFFSLSLCVSVSMSFLCLLRFLCGFH